MMKKILLLVVIAIVANLVYAQNPTPEQMYQMNEGALKMVLDYKAQANMNKPRRFVRLFESEDIQIYNDLLGLSTKKPARFTMYYSKIRYFTTQSLRL